VFFALMGQSSFEKRSKKNRYHKGSGEEKFKTNTIVIFEMLS